MDALDAVNGRQDQSKIDNFNESELKFNRQSILVNQGNPAPL